MSDAPKHIWPGEEELDGINMREWAGDYRYTLTSGPEWDALVKQANEYLDCEMVDSPYAQGIIGDLLAYFEEPRDE